MDPLLYNDEQPLALQTFRMLCGEAFISPYRLAFVHEIGDSETSITEQAWLHSPGMRQGVAVKSFRPTIFSKPGLLRKFLTEVSQLHKLKHKSLVAIRGVGCYHFNTWSDVETSVYLVEEYAGPMSVARLVKALQLHPREPVFSYTYFDALKWCCQVAEALAYLHSQGVPHGDLRLHNMYFTSPEVHETDVRLGDLKPQRLLYLRLKHLAPKGGAGQAQGNGTPRAHGNGISANGDGINGDANSNDIDGNANGVDERASPQQASLQRFSQGMSACCDPLEQDPSALRPLGSTSTSFADPGAVLPVIEEDPYVRSNSMGGADDSVDAKRVVMSTEEGQKISSRPLAANDPVRRLLDEVGKVEPASGCRGSTKDPCIARASWTIGVGPTLRLTAPPTQSTLQDIAHEYHHPQLDAMLQQQGPGAHDTTGDGGGAEGERKRAACVHALHANLGSGYIMVSGKGAGHAVAHAAQQQGGWGGQLEGGSAASMLGSAWARPGARSTGMVGRMYIMQRMANEPAPWAPLLTPHGARALGVNAHPTRSGASGMHEAMRVGLSSFARASYHHTQEYAGVRDRIETNRAGRKQLTDSLKEQVDNLRVGQGGAGGPMGGAEEGQGGGEGQEGQACSANGDGHPKGGKSKKTVSFATTPPHGKLWGRDLAAVYAAPELVHQIPGPDGEVKHTPQSDVFAFAKVLYQLMWKGMIEPDGPTNEAQRAALQNYAKKVAGGFREEMPGYWPQQLRELMAQMWHADPQQRPGMEQVALSLGQWLKDPVFRRQLSEGERHHRNWVAPGTPPGQVYVADESCCVVS